MRSYQAAHKQNTKEIICNKCKKKGHFASNCSNFEKVYDSKHQRKEKTISLNNIEIEKEKTDDDRNMENEAQSDDEIFCIYNLDKLESNQPITTYGLINGKQGTILRDSGCSSIIVNRKFIEKKNFSNKSGNIKVADGKIYKVPKVKININSPYLTGNFEAYCFNTDHDLIIRNVPGAKCHCLNVNTQDIKHNPCIKEDNESFIDSSPKSLIDSEGFKTVESETTRWLVGQRSG